MRNTSIFLIASALMISCGDDGTEIIDLAPCDSDITIDNTDSFDGAVAIDLCQEASLTDPIAWGLISSRYIRASGSVAAPSPQIGIQSAFGSGITPQKGDRMLALSTGSARTPAQPGYCGTSCSGYGTGTPPADFPQAIGSCPGSSDISDDVGLEITLLAPQSAKGFSIDHAFFTLDNAFFCSPFNDQFVIIVDPEPAGSVNGNIAVDEFVNPVNVNMSFITSEATLLEDTGYEGGASTGWLRSTAPVTGGMQITIRFLIWDSGDNASNSTVLIDNFQWLTSTTGVSTSEL